jgi:hypothetical protein
MGDFYPTLTPPKSFIHSQNNNKHQADMDTYRWTHQRCNLEWELGSGHDFCGVGSSCKGFDSNHLLLLKCTLCINVNEVYYGKYDLSWIYHVKMLSHRLFKSTFGHSVSQGILCIYVVTNMR